MRVLRVKYVGKQAKDNKFSVHFLSRIHFCRFGSPESIRLESLILQLQIPRIVSPFVCVWESGDQIPFIQSIRDQGAPSSAVRTYHGVPVAPPLVPTAPPQALPPAAILLLGVPVALLGAASDCLLYVASHSYCNASSVD